jgi:recombinational DNA repair protein (RecF pathway)
VLNIDRTMLGYELISQLHKATEDEPEPEYFHLLQQAFAALDDAAIPLDLIRLWFSAQLLRLGGHTPNLQTEPDGTKLAAGQTYEFSFDGGAFIARPDGAYGANDIKFLRIIFSSVSVRAAAAIAGAAQLTAHTQGLVMSMRQRYIRA